MGGHENFVRRILSNCFNLQNSSLAYWTSVLSPRKLVLNVPAYARTYTLRSASNAMPGAPVSGPGEPGHYTQVAGFHAYYEVSIPTLQKLYFLNVFTYLKWCESKLLYNFRMFNVSYT